MELLIGLGANVNAQGYHNFAPLFAVDYAWEDAVWENMYVRDDVFDEMEDMLVSTGADPVIYDPYE